MRVDYLLACDPGLNCVGWALYAMPYEGTSKDCVLTACGLARSGFCSGSKIARVVDVVQSLASALENLPKPAQLLLEMPQVYRASKSKGDPNDLLPLAAVNGAIAWHFQSAIITEAKPAEWKGQIPKGEVYETRLFSRLTDKEKALIERVNAEISKSLQHNILDAVGIGLYGVGRFDRVRVFAR